MPMCVFQLLGACFFWLWFSMPPPTPPQCTHLSRSTPLEPSLRRELLGAWSSSCGRRREAGGPTRSDDSCRWTDWPHPTPAEQRAPSLTSAGGGTNYWRAPVGHQPEARWSRTRAARCFHGTSRLPTSLAVVLCRFMSPKQS